MLGFLAGWAQSPSTPHPLPHRRCEKRKKTFAWQRQCPNRRTKKNTGILCRNRRSKAACCRINRTRQAWLLKLCSKAAQGAAFKPPETSHQNRWARSLTAGAPCVVLVLPRSGFKAMHDSPCIREGGRCFSSCNDTFDNERIKTLILYAQDQNSIGKKCATFMTTGRPAPAETA